MKKNFLLIGCLLLVLFGVWKGYLENRLTLRIPQGWSYHAQYLGNLVYADENGNIPPGKQLNMYHRDFTLVSWEPTKAVIEDLYRTYDIQNGEITWESKLLFTVDPASGKIISYPGHPEAPGLFYLFPQNTKKQTYTFFSYDLNPIPLEYKREEIREGVVLYVFSYAGPIDFTEIYMDAYIEADFNFPAGARLVTTDYYREIWVEPLTGEIVQFIEDSPGDYIMAPETNEKLAIVAVWSGKYTGKTMDHILQRTKNIMMQLKLFQGYIPYTFLFGGLIILAVGLVSGWKDSSADGETASEN